MSSDNFYPALQGLASGTTDILKLIIQDKMRREARQEDLLAQEESARRMLPIQKDLAAFKTNEDIRQSQANPKLHQLVDYDTGKPIGEPSNILPVPVGRDRSLSSSTSEEDKAFQRARGKQLAQRPQAETAAIGAKSELQRMRAEAEAILNSGNRTKATGMTSWLGKVPGTGARDIRSRIETLKSKTGFSVLQAMREMSKTGGALGQISDKENQLLQDNISSLDVNQSDEGFADSLQRIIDYTKDAEDRIDDGFLRTYDEPFGKGFKSGTKLPLPKSGMGGFGEGDKSGATLMEDANGNKAYVYPDGRVEEIP